MTGRPRHNQHMIRVGQNWDGIGRKAAAVSIWRYRVKMLIIIAIVGMIILCCAGMMA